MQAAIVGLMLNESAYISEIVRSGLESVDRGQNEAALSLGMTPSAAMRRIIVPQAIRVMVPPLGNSFKRPHEADVRAFRHRCRGDLSSGGRR